MWVAARLNSPPLRTPMTIAFDFVRCAKLVIALTGDANSTPARPVSIEGCLLPSLWILNVPREVAMQTAVSQMVHPIAENRTQRFADHRTPASSPEYVKTLNVRPL